MSPVIEEHAVVIHIEQSAREWHECIRFRGYRSYQMLHAVLRHFKSGYRELGLRVRARRCDYCPHWHVATSALRRSEGQP